MKYMNDVNPRVEQDDHPSNHSTYFLTIDETDDRITDFSEYAWMFKVTSYSYIHRAEMNIILTTQVQARIYFMETIVSGYVLAPCWKTTELKNGFRWRYEQN